jgi:hypothetical protein
MPLVVNSCEELMADFAQQKRIPPDSCENSACSKGRLPHAFASTFRHRKSTLLLDDEASNIAVIRNWRERPNVRPGRDLDSEACQISRKQ